MSGRRQQAQREKARTMSDARRAFHALAGLRFPHVGERGWYFPQYVDLADDTPREGLAVDVVALTPSGKTVTVRFACKRVAKQHGALVFQARRRDDGANGAGWYLTKSPVVGEVVFGVAPSVEPRLPWKLRRL